MAGCSSCKGSAAARSILAEATRLAPKRNRLSDGICASFSHSQANPSSDHEPQPDQNCEAMAADVTHDPANGFHAHNYAEIVRTRSLNGDLPALKYIISMRRIFNPSVSSSWRAYNGRNPHDHHAHFSIKDGYRNFTGPWFGNTKPPKPPVEDRPPIIYGTPVQHEWTARKLITIYSQEDDMFQPFMKRNVQINNHDTYDFPWVGKTDEVYNGVKFKRWIVVRALSDIDQWTAQVYTGNGLVSPVNINGHGRASEVVSIPAAGLASVVSLSDVPLDCWYLERIELA